MALINTFFHLLLVHVLLARAQHTFQVSHLQSDATNSEALLIWVPGENACDGTYIQFPIQSSTTFTAAGVGGLSIHGYGASGTTLEVNGELYAGCEGPWTIEHGGLDRCQHDGKDWHGLLQYTCTVHANPPPSSPPTSSHHTSHSQPGTTSKHPSTSKESSTSKHSSTSKQSSSPGHTTSSSSKPGHSSDPTSSKPSSSSPRPSNHLSTEKAKTEEALDQAKQYSSSHSSSILKKLREIIDDAINDAKEALKEAAKDAAKEALIEASITALEAALAAEAADQIINHLNDAIKKESEAEKGGESTPPSKGPTSKPSSQPTSKPSSQSKPSTTPKSTSKSSSTSTLAPVCTAYDVEKQRDVDDASLAQAVKAAVVEDGSVQNNAAAESNPEQARILAKSKTSGKGKSKVRGKCPGAPGREMFICGSKPLCAPAYPTVEEANKPSVPKGKRIDSLYAKPSFTSLDDNWKIPALFPFSDFTKRPNKKKAIACEFSRIKDFLLWVPTHADVFKNRVKAKKDAKDICNAVLTKTFFSTDWPLTGTSSSTTPYAERLFRKFPENADTTGLVGLDTELNLKKLALTSGWSLGRLPKACNKIPTGLKELTNLIFLFDFFNKQPVQAAYKEVSDRMWKELQNLDSDIEKSQISQPQRKLVSKDQKGQEIIFKWADVFTKWEDGFLDHLQIDARNFRNALITQSNTLLTKIINDRKNAKRRTLRMIKEQEAAERLLASIKKTAAERASNARLSLAGFKTLSRQASANVPTAVSFDADWHAAELQDLYDDFIGEVDEDAMDIDGDIADADGDESDLTDIDEDDVANTATFARLAAGEKSDMDVHELLKTLEEPGEGHDTGANGGDGPGSNGKVPHDEL